MQSDPGSAVRHRGRGDPVGVRTILGELVPAFRARREGLPAIGPRRPAVFPYAQNAVLIGFLSSFAGGPVGPLVPACGPARCRPALILPGLVPHFFTGGAAGVYGNYRRPTRRGRGRVRQRPAGHLPARPAAEGAGHLRLGEHHLRRHRLRLVRHPHRLLGAHRGAARHRPADRAGRRAPGSRDPHAASCSGHKLGSLARARPRRAAAGADEPSCRRPVGVAAGAPPAPPGSITRGRPARRRTAPTAAG